MSKKTKKAMSMLLVVALIAVIAVGGMLAYLTSEDSDVNVMTLGNVEIEQIEQQLNAANEKEPFVQAKEFYPATTISKIVSVKNIGKSDCYFRTLIAFETIDSGTFGYDFTIDGQNYTCDKENPVATFVNDEGTKFEVYEVVYNGVLAVGETSPASLTEVSLSKDCTNDDMKALGGTYEVLVLSQAVQTAGFEAGANTRSTSNASKYALDTAFRAVTNETAADWFGGMVIPVVTSNSKELKAALENGDSVVLTEDVTLDASVTIDNRVEIDLNGNTLSTVGLEMKHGGVIENGQIESAGKTQGVPHFKVSSGTLIMDNMNIYVDDYLNYQAQGNRAYAEITGMDITNAIVIMNDCNIHVKNDTYRTWNYIYGITIIDGDLTMNGGSITVESAGAAIQDLETAVSAIGAVNVTMNNVNVDAETVGTTMGHLVLNTTDTSVDSSRFVSFGGTYELNYIK